MTKDQMRSIEEALDLALEALENSVDLVREDAYNAEQLYGKYPSRQARVQGLKVLADDHEKAITAIKQARALDKMADNARELGLDYKPVQEFSYKGPEELWLQLHGDCSDDELTDPVDYTDDSVTWCWHQIHDNDVRYVRADISTPPAQPAVPDAFGTREGEHPQYIQGWNDCRAEMLRGFKEKQA